MFRCCLFVVCLLIAPFINAENKKSDRLKIGITLHPYFAYVANIVGDKADVLPLVDTGFNSHNYYLNPADIARLKALDVLVVNGIGHDDFAIEAVEKIKPENLTVIHANSDVPLLGGRSKSNPHTFVAVDAAVRQVYSITKTLSSLDSKNAKTYRKNAYAYAKKLRDLKRPLQTLLIEKDLSQVRIASTHNAYGYLLQEFGLTVSAVVEPAHGISPTASQLQKTIDRIREANIDVLFTELNMVNSYVDTIEKETGVRVFHFSHMTYGDYTKNLVEVEMGHNLEKLQEALLFALQRKKT